MPKINITDKFIKNQLTCPEDKTRIEYCDKSLPGLYVEVRATSQEQGTYYFRYKDDTGKTCHQKIGRTIDISLKDARAAAKTLRAEIQLGANPRAEARARKQVMNWDEFFTDRYLPHAKQHKRSWKNDLEMHNLRLKPKFGRLRLNRITRHAAQQFHSGLKESGFAPATADHHLKLIRQALNLAVEWELLDTNPVAKVKLFNEDNREERLMTDDELQRLMAVLDKDHRRTACHVVKFLLYTGARANEALKAEWADIDRGNSTWLIRSATSKSKRRRSVPLNAPALALLDQLGTAGKSPYLFTNVKTGKRLTTIGKVWRKLRVDAELPHLRLHDLRHQYASMLINSDRSLYEVQQILGHSDPSVTQRYAHLSTKALQDAANSVDRYMEDALESTS